MLRRDIEKLIRIIEPQVISILKAHGLITDPKKKMKYGSVVLTQKGKALIGLSDIPITEQWLTSWMELWPVGFRGSRATIRDKLNRFLQEHDCSLDEIIESTNRWLQDKNTPYHGSAHHFFYKMEGIDSEISRCEEYLDIIRSPDKKSDRNFFVE